MFLLLIFSIVGQHPITPETALQSYLNNEDATTAWEVRDSYAIDDVITAYSIFLISQKWQGILWKHELIIFVPETINYDGALLFITGSSVKDGLPKISKQSDEILSDMASLAHKNNAIVALLYQVPNQPLYEGLYEDALISYTLNEFKKNEDYSFPLLFPMVKSTCRAMDVVQEFSFRNLNHNLNRFVVSGASKRGWTTWLTGASEDSRVVAIAPMVIDMLNMPATLEYQKEIYGEYSEDIQDYVELEIPQAINSKFGNAVVKMIDPYSYRDKLIMPKMIIFGTNDPFWTVDAVKHYINEIPGNNLLHYISNVGHSLGDAKQAFNALSAFLAINLNNSALPNYTWSLNENKKYIDLKVKTTPDNFVRAVLWTSTSESRDFRKAVWNSTDIKINKKDKSDVCVRLEYPISEFRAFYIDLIYQDPRGEEYSVSTRMYVADKNQVFVK